MKLHEYQAKGIFSQYGVPVPKGSVATTPEEVRQITAGMGGRAVVKAQVHAGGRGKAGGVKVMNSPEDAAQFAASLLGRNLMTHQTGPEGAPIRKLLVEEVQPIVKEMYLSITIDAAARGPVIIASEAGGMDIEEVAARTPEKIIRIAPHPTAGLLPFQARKIAYAFGLKGDQVRDVANLVTNLWRMFYEKDCSLVEINPLAVVGEGRIVALDGKISLEDDALYRHKDLEGLRDPEQEDPLEREAISNDIAYVRLDGDVGCVVNGAGLAMATMDMVTLVGAKPANFLDVGGGAEEEKVKKAFSILLSDPRVNKVLINVFGGILRCDILARGVVAACKEKGSHPPMIARLQGTNKDEGRRILAESGLNVTLIDTLHEAAELLR